MALTLAAHGPGRGDGRQPVLQQAADDRDLRPLFASAADLVARDPSQQLALTVYGHRPARRSPGPAGRRNWPSIPRPGRPGAGRAGAAAPLFVAPGPARFPAGARRAGHGAATPATRSCWAWWPPSTSSPSAPSRGARPANNSASTPPSRPWSCETPIRGGRRPPEPVQLRRHLSVGRDAGRGARRSGRRSTRPAARTARSCFDLMVAVLAVTAAAAGRSVPRPAATGADDLALRVGDAGGGRPGRRRPAGCSRIALPPGARRGRCRPTVYHWPQLGLARPGIRRISCCRAWRCSRWSPLLAGPLERRRQIFHGSRRDAAGRRRAGRAVRRSCRRRAARCSRSPSSGTSGSFGETFRRTTVDHPAVLAAPVGDRADGDGASAWSASTPRSPGRSSSRLRLLLARWRFRRGDVRVAALLLLAWGLPVGRRLDAGLERGGSPTCRGVEALLVVGAVAAAAYLGPTGSGAAAPRLPGLPAVRHAVRAAVTGRGDVPVARVLPGRRRAPRWSNPSSAPKCWTSARTCRTRLQRRAGGDRRPRGGARSLRVGAGAAAGIACAHRQCVPHLAGHRARAVSGVVGHRALQQRRRCSSAGSRSTCPRRRSASRWREEDCTWRTFGEVSPFGSHERQLLHAGRNICTPDRRVLGTIVIHVILDYSTLSFLSSQSPYLELLRGQRRRSAADDVRGRDVNFVVYGWSRTPLYVSGNSAWPIDDALFARIYASRRPFWTRLPLSGADYHVYFENDRSGIYALGYPMVSADRALHQPRRADRAGRLRLHRPPARRGPLPRGRRAPDAVRPGAAARDPRELLPQAVPRVRGRVGHPGRRRSPW